MVQSRRKVVVSSRLGFAMRRLENCQPISKWVRLRIRQRKERHGLRLPFAMPNIQWDLPLLIWSSDRASSIRTLCEFVKDELVEFSRWSNQNFFQKERKARKKEKKREKSREDMPVTSCGISYVRCSNLLEGIQDFNSFV